MWLKQKVADPREAKAFYLGDTIAVDPSWSFMTLKASPFNNFKNSLAEWRWRRHRSVTGWFERSEYPQNWTIIDCTLKGCSNNWNIGYWGTPPGCIMRAVTSGGALSAYPAVTQAETPSASIARLGQQLYYCHDLTAPIPANFYDTNQ